MKGMRKLLAGFLTAAMIFTTAVPAQAVSLNESSQGEIKAETVQDDSVGDSKAGNVSNDSVDSSQDETAAEDGKAGNVSNDSADNSQDGAADGESAGDSQSETAAGETNEDNQNGNAQGDTAEGSQEDNAQESGQTESTENQEVPEQELGEENLELAAPSGTFTIQNVASGKYVKTYSAGNTPLTVDGEANNPDILFKSDIKYKTDYLDMLVCNFISNSYNNGMNSGLGDFVQVQGGDGIGGWESIRYVPNGDGTISFRATNEANGSFITVADDYRMVRNSGLTADNLTDKEKFVITCQTAPNDAVEGLEMKEATVDSINLSWKMRDERDIQSIYTNNILYYKESSESTYTNKKNVGISTSYQVKGLKTGSYDFKLVTVNGQGDPLNDAVASTGIELKNCTTKLYKTPDVPEELKMEQLGNGKLKLSWKASNRASYYIIQHGESRFDTGFEDLKAGGKLVATTGTSIEVTPSKNPYQDYYRVVAVSGGTPDAPVEDEERSQGSDGIGPEMELFGSHTIIFSPKDETKRIDELLDEIFEDANDFDADAQFNGEHWQIYFKPGDYTETKCMYLGFYTSFNGLGKTPYDVKLNNIAIPAYLSEGELGGNGENATCNFWRSAENLSVINTGNEQGKAEYGSNRQEHFNWAVAQAAPLRRVYSDRQVAYDWNWGWASGGYVADCYFTGHGTDQWGGWTEGAGTHSGQQFYTRNSKMEGPVYGTTLNNFFQGVEAPNLTAGDKGDPLMSKEGYSTWNTGNIGEGQRVFTSITKTEKISEKPFLYLNDNGEYEIFVPAVRENVKGISWSKKSMGEGESLPLDRFYIAKPTDSAAVINAQLAAGKNIYFTPGVYRAEVPIRVTNPDTILLGTGMTTIIPDNEEMAMEVADVDGVRLEGLIFDAGAHSKYLLKVGEKGKHTSHAEDPIILQDLFLRIGGTSDKLTKADYGMEINSDDVIGDHFWIWRADHGAGVEWYGNESINGLIVNGDNVYCYALFNEHFQSYHTLWNGENGKTYFYQNETCYDPISQDKWMSHKGTVNGYASYKVSNKVNKHYAVGLGIYNVFIYTGPTYDSSEVKIQLDNAIEVPNKPGVLVENACIQTFANDDSALQKINHIINGVGYGVSSGRLDEETLEKGEGWSRKFLIYYRNGKAVYGKMPEADEKGLYIGTESQTGIPQPMNDEGDVDLMELQKLYSSLKKESSYTNWSWKNSGIVEAKEAARVQIEDKGLDWAVQAEVDSAYENLKAVMAKLVRMPQNFANTGTGTTSLKMTWKKDTNIDKYKLVLYDKKGKKLKTVTTKKNSYKFTKLSKVTTYQVGIYAIKMDGKKEVTSQQLKVKTSTSPAKVTLSKFSKKSSSKAKVTWEKVNGASGYEIYLKTGNGKYKKVKTISKGSTESYTISKLKKKTKYTVKVRAYRKAGSNKIYGSYSKTKKVKM